MKLTTETTSGLTVTAFPPPWLRVFTQPLGDRIDHTVPVRIEEAYAQSSRVVAALDGPMFGRCSPGDYGTYTCADLQYLLVDRASGLFVASERPTDGITIFVTADGTAGWARDATSPPDALVAVQLYPSLLEDGAITATNTGTNTETVWRAAMGILRDGRIAFAVFLGTMQGFARALLAYGFVTAGYTDGGGSGGMITQGHRAGSAEHRRIASVLLAVQPAVVQATTMVPIVLVAGSLLAVGAWAYTRRNRTNQ